MATALVIGGSGQIGRAVVPALLEDGWDVRVLARHAADVGGAQLVLGDRQDPDALDAALAGGVDVLVDVVAYDDRQAAPLIERGRPDRVGGRRLQRGASTSTTRATGSSPRSSASFPVPVTEDQPTVATRARLLRHRQGGARAGVVGVDRARRRSCGRAPSTARAASSRASGRS